jgi:glycosyltransferase involved in cell wall biosynthesis
MDWIQNNRPAVDLLIVIDIDIDSFSEESVVRTIKAAPNDWMALFSNGVKYIDFLGKRIPCKYYDDSAYIPFSDEKEPKVELTLSEIKRNRDALSRDLKNTAFQKCFSAFGGIGIYRYQYIKDTKYATKKNTKNLYAESICEHIPFNLPLRKYGTCYIVRDFFVYHTRIQTLRRIFLELLPTEIWLLLYKNFKIEYLQQKINRSKKVLINGDFLCRRITGVERYAYELTERLDKLIAPDEIAIIIPANARTIPDYKNLEIIRHKKNAKSHIWWQMFVLQDFLAVHKKYTCLEFGNTCLPLAPGIVFLHDIYCEFFPEDFNTLRDKVARLYNRWQYRLIARKAKQIATVSNFSKRQIAATFHVNPDTITVIYNGWNHFGPIQTDYSVFKEFPVLSKPFYFSLGSLSKRKNIKWIYKYASAHPDTLFAISGESLPTTKLTALDIPSVRSNILFLGYLSDAKVKALMEKCKAFIHPSYYEGFGIPPLEALSCGAEVIIANAASLPEIYGNTAHYIDPFSTDVDLDALLQEPVMSADAILKKYSYDTAAKQLYDMIKTPTPPPPNFPLKKRS